MTEKFLHYLWKMKLLPNHQLLTSAGEIIQIISAGDHNTDAGPDFLNARIKIDNTEWAGNVEIHLNSSDWHLHHHDADKAYDNIILHVVFENDSPILRTDGTVIPCLVIKRRFDPSLIWAEFGPQVTGSVFVASITGAAAVVLALCASARRATAAVFVNLLTFLLGGQLVAIALIRLYNHPSTTFFYESAATVTMAYLGRFGWIALLAATATWSAPWRHLRDLAAVDGASKLAAARYVVWPLAWPILGASALFIATLSLSEVPATVLLSPQRPQMLVPLLMTWVHMLRYDAMIEASLLTAGLVIVIGAAAALLYFVGVRSMSHVKWQMSNGKSARTLAICLLTFAICHLTSGCDPLTQPDEIWLETGTAPADGSHVRTHGVRVEAGRILLDPAALRP